MPLLRAIVAATALVVGAPTAFRPRQLTYIDPGSGSFLIQIAIATVLGGAVMARLWFSQLVGIFRRKQPADDEGEPMPAADQDRTTDDVEPG